MTKSGFNFAKAIGAHVQAAQKPSNSTTASSRTNRAASSSSQVQQNVQSFAAHGSGCKPSKAVSKPQVVTAPPSTASDTSDDDIPELVPARDVMFPASAVEVPAANPGMCIILQQQIQTKLDQVQALLHKPEDFLGMRPHLEFLMGEVFKDLAQHDKLLSEGIEDEGLKQRLADQVQTLHELAASRNSAIEEKAAEQSGKQAAKKKKKKKKKKVAANAAEPAGPELVQVDGSAETQTEGSSAKGSTQQVSQEPAVASNAMNSTQPAERRSIDSQFPSEVKSDAYGAVGDAISHHDADGWGSSDEEEAVAGGGGDSGNMFALLAAMDGGEDSVSSLSSKSSRRRRRTPAYPDAACGVAGDVKGTLGDTVGSDAEQLVQDAGFDSNDAQEVADQSKGSNDQGRDAQRAKQPGQPAVQKQWQQQFAGIAKQRSSSSLQKLAGHVNLEQRAVGEATEVAGGEEGQHWDGTGQGYQRDGGRGPRGRGRGISQGAEYTGFDDEFTPAPDGNVHDINRSRGRGRGRGRFQAAQVMQGYQYNTDYVQGDATCGGEDFEFSGHAVGGDGRGRGMHSKVHSAAYTNQPITQDQGPPSRRKMTYQELHARYYQQPQQPQQGEQQAKTAHNAGAVAYKPQQQGSQDGEPTWQQQQLMQSRQPQQHSPYYLAAGMAQAPTEPKEQPTWQQKMLSYAARPQHQFPTTTTGSSPYTSPRSFPSAATSLAAGTVSGYITSPPPPPPPRRPAEAAAVRAVVTGPLTSGSVSHLAYPATGHPIAHTRQAGPLKLSGAALHRHNSVAAGYMHAQVAAAPGTAHNVAHELGFSEQPAEIVRPASGVGPKREQPAASVFVGQEGVQEGQEEEDRVPECCVCLEEMPNCVLRPCGHPLCSGCFPLIVEKHGTCPICRTPIEDCLRMWA